MYRNNSSLFENLPFCPHWSWERFWVVTLKGRYINFWMNEWMWILLLDFADMHGIVLGEVWRRRSVTVCVRVAVRKRCDRLQWMESQPVCTHSVFRTSSTHRGLKKGLRLLQRSVCPMDHYYRLLNGSSVHGLQLSVDWSIARLHALLKAMYSFLRHRSGSSLLW